MSVPESLLPLAVEMARDAGALLLERFGGPARGVDTKSTAIDLVSDADRDAEALLRATLARERPNDAILGEEGGGTAGGSGLRWVIDPLDGTTNYLYGYPAWAVSIAVQDDEGWMVGVVYDPTRDELFAAGRGAGATLNGAADLGHGAEDRPEWALLATGYPMRRSLACVRAGPPLNSSRACATYAAADRPPSIWPGLRQAASTPTTKSPSRSGTVLPVNYS